MPAPRSLWFFKHAVAMCRITASRRTLVGVGLLAVALAVVAHAVGADTAGLAGLQPAALSSVLAPAGDE